jgi:rubrerythrin
MKRKSSAVRKGGKTDKEIFDISEWRCEACGHIDYGYKTSEGCPYCFYPDNAFTKMVAAGIKPR